MVMTDPVADMLTRIRNANMSMHEDVVIPSSKLKVDLAKLLKQEGYISEFRVTAAEDSPGDMLTIDLKYSPRRERVITGLRRISKPGLRMYSKAAAPRVLGGLGVAVISTSRGLMTDEEARRRKLGGEVLCHIW